MDDLARHFVKWYPLTLGAALALGLIGLLIGGWWALVAIALIAPVEYVLLWRAGDLGKTFRHHAPD